MSVARDLERRRERPDAWAHALAADPTLAAWAHDTVIAPESDRDLGQLAAWADSVTDRRASS